MKKKYDVVIIGSGIAGMSAALYLKRANIDLLLIENNVPGGQINYTSVIENYPGFNNINGTDFNMNVLEQLKNIEVVPQYFDIKKIITKGEYKEIITNSETIMCKNIVIATGRRPKKLRLENEEKFIGNGLSWCGFCDGNLYKDKDVIVIGAGASALEESIYLSKICNKVTIINKYDFFKSDKLLYEKVENNSKIEIIYNAQTKKYIVENNKIFGIIINREEKEEKIFASGIFIYVGYEPNTELIMDSNIIMDNNYIIVDENGMTNVDGIYACGDVVKKQFYQIILASADGVNVALNIIKSMTS